MDEPIIFYLLASIWAKKTEIGPQITQHVDQNRHFLTSRPQYGPNKADFAPVWVKKGTFQPKILISVDDPIIFYLLASIWVKKTDI